MGRVVAGLLACCALALGACDGDPAGETTTTKPPKVETVDQLPRLPEGWKPFVDRPGGFAVGLPRGWTADRKGTTVLIRSFDRLVAISISPDRTDEALDLDPSRFATRALAALPGLSSAAQPSEPRPYEHHYTAVQSKLEAKDSATQVRQRLSLIVIRRDHLATFTVVIAASADPRAHPAEELARKLVATLRSRPVSVGGH